MKSKQWHLHQPDGSLLFAAIRKWTANFHSSEPKAAFSQTRKGKSRAGESNKCVFLQISGYSVSTETSRRRCCPQLEKQQGGGELDLYVISKPHTWQSTWQAEQRFMFLFGFLIQKKYSGRGRILAIYCEAPLDQISANDSHLFPPFRNDLLYKLMSAYLNALSDSVLGAMAISDRDWGWTHQSCGSQYCHYVHW